jgi:hypothetical protein
MHRIEPPEAQRLSNKHHTESSKSHNARKEHDRKVRQYEETTSNPWHQSKGARIGMAVIAVVAIVSITLLFVSGVIRW